MYRHHRGNSCHIEEAKGHQDLLPLYRNPSPPPGLLPQSPQPPSQQLISLQHTGDDGVEKRLYAPDRLVKQGRGQSLRMCNVCMSFCPNNQEDASQHASTHPDRAFKVHIPAEMWYFTVAEVVMHFVSHGFSQKGLGEKLVSEKLFMYPTSLVGLSCSKCEEGRALLDATTEDEFVTHMQDVCGVVDRGRMRRYLLPWCRGCGTTFKTKDDLLFHVQQLKTQGKKCFPDPAVIRHIVKTAAELMADMPATVKQEVTGLPQVPLRSLPGGQPSRQNMLRNNLNNRPSRTDTDSSEQVCLYVVKIEDYKTYVSNL